LPKKEQKPWVEISADEKIERLREVIKELQRRSSIKHRELNSFKEKFFNHQHYNGEIISKMERYDRGGEVGLCAGDVDPKKAYF